MDYKEEIIAMLCGIEHEGVLRFFYSLFFITVNDDAVMSALEEYADT